MQAIHRHAKMIEHSSHAAFDLSNRQRKAEKIHALLRPWIAGHDGLRLLEVGTGSGAIAHYFAARVPGCDVFSVDVVDQRRVIQGFSFSEYDGSRLPFADGSFDVLVSNHVIEHVGDRNRQFEHLSEMARVLREDGTVYVAMPSRWQLIEPHFRLIFLSWVPRKWRGSYVRACQRGVRYDCDPMGHAEFERMAVAAGFNARNINAIAMRETFLREPGVFARFIARVPENFLQRFYRFSPTMVYVLRKKNCPKIGSGP